MISLLQSVLAFVFARIGSFLLFGAIIVVAGALYLAGQHYFNDAERRAGEVSELLELRESRLEALREELRQSAGKAEEAVRGLADQAEAGKQALEDIRKQKEALDSTIRNIQTIWLHVQAWFSADAQEELHRARAAREELEKHSATQETALAKLNRERAAMEQGQRGSETLVRDELDSVTADIARLSGERDQLSTIADARKKTLDAILFWLKKGWEASFPALLLLAFGIFVLPWLAKIFFYFAWAPLLEKADPIRLSGHPPAAPLSVGVSQPALEVSLLPGQRLLMHHAFLQASDAGLSKKTRFLFDWRFPLASIACQLYELTEITNTQEKQRRVTVSNQSDPTCEVALVEIPAGASLVLRPRQLVAIRLADADSRRIRSRWRIRNLHAWITLQFRYFEFEGPCALVVKGQRGIRAESVTPDDARVTNQSATLGFTPDLHYSSRRAETFWSYFRGHNTLFDDAFSGTGVFLCQQISKDDQFHPTRFWKGIGDTLLKAFGI